MVFYDLGGFNKSLKYLNKAIDICGEMRYTSKKADTCNYIGTVLFSISRSILHKHNRVINLEKALQYQKAALNIHEELGHNIRTAIDCYNEALIFYDMKKHKEANEMITKSRMLSLKQEEKTAHHYPVIDQINNLDSQLNKRNVRGIIRKKDLLNIKINKKKFLLNQLKWWTTTTLASVGIGLFFPFPVSIPVIVAAVIWISFLWRKRQLKKIGISKKRFVPFSSYYYKQYILRDLRSIGISFAIGYGISFFVPFPYNLAFGWGVYPLINYKITKNATERLGTITSYKKFYQKPISLLFDPTSNI